jgi:hypothetical protein
METNRHPADRLAEVREEIENLKAKEKFLRAILLRNERDRRGEEWRAWPQEHSRQRLDAVAAKNHLGDLLDPFYVTSTFTTLRLVKVIGSAANGFPARDIQMGAGQ